MKLTKIAVGNGSISYRDVENLSREVKLSSSITPVRNGNVITNIVKYSIDVREIVASPAGCPSDCPPKFPAVVKVSFSAPEGVDIKGLAGIENFFSNLAISKSGALIPFVTDQPTIEIL